MCYRLLHSVVYSSIRSLKIVKTINTYMSTWYSIAIAIAIEELVQ